MKKYAFLEDELFSGTPKSKFFDIVKNASSEIVEDEIDKILEKYAVMELLLSKDKDDSYDINQEIEQYLLQNLDEVNRVKDGLYLEFTGEIVCRLDS